MKKILRKDGKDAEPVWKKIAEEFGLAEHFPENVLAETARFPGKIPTGEIKCRSDFRRLDVFTVDPADAKDFDDAVSLEKVSDERFRLGVHIADVSHYVAEGSGVDRSALERGTSVYLSDRVLPMLPERLSNDLCSLRALEDRLVLSVVMEITSDGEITGYNIVPAIIRVRQRLVYEQVAKALAKNEFSWLTGQHSGEVLRRMAELAMAMRRKRIAAGSLDLDMPETRLVMHNGQPVRVERVERTIAHQMIEEFMLAANETIAWHLGHKLKMPMIYRIHERPDETDLAELRELVAGLGFYLPRKNIGSRDLQILMDNAGRTPRSSMVSTMILRSLKLAEYSDRNTGHFALAKKYYTHFTSPIRRYPDLIVHRILREKMFSGTDHDFRRRHWEKNLPVIADHCSEQERLAQKAEESESKLLRVQLLTEEVGETFTGIITGFVKFGIFVELSDFQIDGLVHVRDMRDDYYYLDGKRHRMSGRRTGKTFRLGDSVKVRLVKVDTEKTRIDLVLIKDK